MTLRTIAIIAGVLLCGIAILAFLISLRCGGEVLQRRHGEIESQRARTIELLSGESLDTKIVQMNRQVEDIKLDGLFTVIERRGHCSEVGVYDTVWVPAKSCYYTFVGYRYHDAYRTLDFTAAWPRTSSDTSPVTYFMMERRRPYQADTTTKVSTNLESVELVKQFAGLPIDTLKQWTRDVEISYELLGSQPMKFFTQIRIGGQPLYIYSPESQIVY